MIVLVELNFVVYIALVLLALCCSARAGDDCSKAMCDNVPAVGTRCMAGTLGESLCITNGSVTTFPADA